ncbi:MAG TPA: DUF262 domain-containing HNH endonuclease family protein [Pseudomonadales bacterium]
MKIESTDVDIRTLLTSGYYSVPRFQRPYSWDQENIREFWDDVVRDNLGDYFIGSMVVYKKGDQRFGIVDGQQRLTTITILLCVLRDTLEAVGEQNLALGLHALIERNNIDNEPEYVLATESSYPYFQDNIQKYGEPELEAELHFEEKSLQSAHELFRKFVKDLVNSIESDPTVPAADIRQTIKGKLAEVRDSLLALSVILVKLDDEDDAYLIFETLNTRGKDLALSDLVKNHITKHLKTKSASIDHTKEKWRSILETIEGSPAEISTDNFIHHCWLSRYEYLPAKKLFKVLKKRIKKKDAKEFLESLVADAKHYRSIHDISYGKWTKQESQVEASLSALMLFRVKQQIPCVLSLLRAYRNGLIKKRLFERALLYIERFHFLFTAITSQRSSGGISSMYASLGRRIFEAGSSSDISDIVSELRIKLRERIPSEEEFRALLPELIFTNQVSKQRLLVRYVLLGISKYEKQSYPVDVQHLTIEHLAPQSNLSNGWEEAEIGQLGNLILVSEDTNQRLMNKAFLEKKEILINEGYKLPTIIADADKWTRDMISDRTDDIAQTAYQQIWAI